MRKTEDDRTDFLFQVLDLLPIDGQPINLHEVTDIYFSKFDTALSHKTVVNNLNKALRELSRKGLVKIVGECHAYHYYRSDNTKAKVYEWQRAMPSVNALKSCLPGHLNDIIFKLLQKKYKASAKYVQAELNYLMKKEEVFCSLVNGQPVYSKTKSNVLSIKKQAQKVSVKA